MEEAERQILETFDRLGLSRLAAADFGSPDRPAPPKATLDQLVESGSLREVGDRYERTEWGRLEIAGPHEVTLLGRVGCHLCEGVLRQIEPLVARFGAKLRTVDVDTDRILRERYGNEIPVVFLGNTEWARHRIDPDGFRAELKRLQGSP
jgi:hypothetical protein